MNKEQEFIRFRNERMKRKRRKKIIRITIVILFLLTIIICGIICLSKHYTGNTVSKTDYMAETAPTSTPEATPTIQPTPEPTVAPTPNPTPVPTPNMQRRGTATSIPDEIRAYMNGRSMRQNPNIGYENLSYLTIPHYDFNYNIVEGHLIVNNKIAEEVLDIFAELYDIKYPIERMELIDKYNADDFESIEYNNTSAFNYRESTDGSGRLSKHALGFAIDINPQINPYVNSNGTGAHANAKEYWSRDITKWTSEIAKAAYIGRDAEIYNIFVNKHGWEWGGSWSSYRDYQHFQKVI